MEYHVTVDDSYRHYKGGLYKICGKATHTESEEDLVIYRDSKGCTWARPVEMFFGYLDDGRKRFTLIEKDEEK